jgi:bifunctional non-homologous end joining protein LigD
VKRAKIEMPGFVRPQLATLKTKAPAGEQWFHEVKYDAATGSKFTSTAAGRRSTPATDSTGRNASPPLPAPSISRDKQSSTGRWTSSTKAGPISELQAELAAGRQDRLVY